MRHVAESRFKRTPVQVRRSQLDLFDYRLRPSCNAECKRAPYTREEENRSRPVSVVEIVSQLDETKLSRFFHYVFCPEDDETLKRRTTSHSLARAEVSLTSIEDDWNGFSAYFFNQVVQLPTALWYADAIQQYFEESLSSAFWDIKRSPDLLKKFDGTQTFEFYESGWAARPTA